jgi:hypothetical protein
VVLRLEESDDEARSLKRLDHWMHVRKGCEESGACMGGELFVVMSIPIPKIRAFSSSNPVRPNVPIVDVPRFLKAAIGHVDTVWKASKDRGAWFYNGGGSASVGRTSLIWSLVEPFSLTGYTHTLTRTHTRAEREIARVLSGVSEARVQCVHF